MYRYTRSPGLPSTVTGKTASSRIGLGTSSIGPSPAVVVVAPPWIEGPGTPSEPPHPPQPPQSLWPPAPPTNRPATSLAAEPFMRRRPAPPLPPSAPHAHPIPPEFPGPPV